jgi:hypothetical protein
MWYLISGECPAGCVAAMAHPVLLAEVARAEAELTTRVSLLQEEVSQAEQTVARLRASANRQGPVHVHGKAPSTVAEI